MTFFEPVLSPPSKDIVKTFDVQGTNQKNSLRRDQADRILLLAIFECMNIALGLKKKAKRPEEHGENSGSSSQQQYNNKNTLTNLQRKKKRFFLVVTFLIYLFM